MQLDSGEETKTMKELRDKPKTYTAEELHMSPEQFVKKCKPIIDECMTELADAIVAEVNKMDKGEGRDGD